MFIINHCIIKYITYYFIFISIFLSTLISNISTNSYSHWVMLLVNPPSNQWIMFPTQASPPCDEVASFTIRGIGPSRAISICWGILEASVRSLPWVLLEARESWITGHSTRATCYPNWGMTEAIAYIMLVSVCPWWVRPRKTLDETSRCLALNFRGERPRLLNRC